MLSIRNLSKSYNKSKIKAVDNLNLELREGEIFGFLGPNGAGKTTTIKLIMGILNIDEGEISICGHNLAKSPIEAKKCIGYVTDNEVAYNALTGKEYINFLADIYGVSEAKRRERIDKMLDMFALKDAYTSPIKTYSHGMKQKISIIGALIHNPKLWVLDEPMTGLDPQSSYHLKELMKEHCRNGNTVFFSTHVLDVAEKLCDRVGIIVGGQLKLVGTIDEIKAKKQDETLEEVFLSIANTNISEELSKNNAQAEA